MLGPAADLGMTALVCPVGLGRAGSIRPLSSLRRKGRRPNRTASAAPSRTRRAQPMRAGRLAWRRGRGCTCAREGRAPGGPMRGAWAGPRARRRFLSRGFGTGGRGGEGGRGWWSWWGGEDAVRLCGGWRARERSRTDSKGGSPWSWSGWGS